MTYRGGELACHTFQERKQRTVNPRCMSCVSGEIGFLVVSKDRESLVGETKKQKPKCVERFLPSLILLSLQMCPMYWESRQSAPIPSFQAETVVSTRSINSQSLKDA